SNRARNRRFAPFRTRLDAMSRPVSILDVGGTEDFWRSRGVLPSRELRIVLLNLAAKKTSDGFESVAGDAADLRQYRDGEFDIAFSNSVIEHLFTEANQRAMAREVQRVARNHWIQTPNFWFPIEPHFLFPGWQWLPRAIRVATIRRTRVGQRGPGRTDAEAAAIVDEVRMLSVRDMRSFFPKSRMAPERFLGLVKSWTAVGGPDLDPPGS
ncbi:MAG: class I SAM-dependent methyltransferase, partial [Planctomycetota bacterium]